MRRRSESFYTKSIEEFSNLTEVILVKISSQLAALKLKEKLRDCPKS